MKNKRGWIAVAIIFFILAIIGVFLLIVFLNAEYIVEANNIHIVQGAIEKSTVNDKINEKTCENDGETNDLQSMNSEAQIEVSQKDFSTLQTNENVQITVRLLNFNTKQKLFKNPVLQIILPKEVEKVKVKSINKLYADEFQFGRPTLEKVETGERVIKIPLIGEQKDYIDGLTAGATIVVDADITFTKTTPTGTSSIILKYTNENQSGQVLEKEASININSKYGILVYSKIVKDDNEQEEQMDNTHTQIHLDADSGNKKIHIERNIINNYEKELDDLVIIGEIPDNPNLQTNLFGDVKFSDDNAKIYYSNDLNTPIDSNAWKEDASSLEKIRKYKIVLQEPGMLPAKVGTLTYDLELPENINYNQNTFDKIIIDYKYGKHDILNEYITNFTTPSEPPTELALESNKMPTITVMKISGQKQLNDGDEIYGGQAVKVRLTVNNDTGVDIANLHLKATQTNAIFYGERIVKGNEDTPGDMKQYTYYEEVPSITEKEFDTKLLKKGETVTYEYEFSVKPLDGEQTVGQLEVSSDSFTAQKTQLMSNKIKKAKLKLKVYYAKNEEVPIVSGNRVMMYLDVENLSESNLSNIDINLPIPENTNYSEMLILPYANDSDEYDFIGNDNNNLKFKINSIQSNQTISILAGFMAEEFIGDTKQIKAEFTASVDGETYISNELEKEVQGQKNLDISIKLDGDVSEKTLQTGDKLIYTGTITNKSDKSEKITVSDYVPEAAVVKSVYVLKDGEEIPVQVTNNNAIEYTTEIQANEEFKLIIQTEIDELKAKTAILTNKLTATLDEQYLESNEVSYRLKNVIDSSTSESSISGQVWLDVNKNGEKDGQDIGLQGITVRLLNMENGQFITDINGNILVATTNVDGLYSFNNLNPGRYAVVFLYDTNSYSLTDYKKEGIQENVNSDVIERKINGLTIGITDALDIDVDITNDIDMGLIQKPIFDLKLDKSITKSTAITRKGNSETSYNDTKLAKVEIYRKDIEKSQVIVEYKISITNNGEIAGYASEITEDIPEGFELYNVADTNWYKDEDGKLKSTALAEQLINPGETKTLYLSLIKQMTGENTGTFKNTAEITKSTNDSAIQDHDSNNNSSSAEALISVSTGAANFIVLAICIVLVLLIAVAIVVFIKKRRGETNA